MMEVTIKIITIIIFVYDIYVKFDQQRSITMMMIMAALTMPLPKKTLNTLPMILAKAFDKEELLGHKNSC